MSSTDAPATPTPGVEGGSGNQITYDDLQTFIQNSVAEALRSMPKIRIRDPMPEFKKKHIDMIPVFTGEPSQLRRFLEITQMIVDKFYDDEDESNFQNEEVMFNIMNKIQGPAADMLQAYTCSNYKELKAALTDSYSDKRDIYTLCFEITAMRQRETESAKEFHDRIVKLLNLIISFINNQSPVTSRKILIEHYQQLALRSLLLHLRDPLGAQLRTRQPRNLGEALTWITNDYQTQELRRGFNKNSTKNVGNSNNNNQGTNIKPGNSAYNSGYKPNRPSQNNFKPSPKPEGNAQNQKQVQTQPPAKAPSVQKSFQKISPMSWQTTRPSCNCLTESEDANPEPTNENETETDHSENPFLEEGTETPEST